MKIPKTVQLGHPALCQVALAVKPEQCAELAVGLDRAMRRANYPAGLALPQLGISLRGFMVNGRIARDGQPFWHRYCFNPEFMWDEKAGSSVQSEECLSLPGKTCYVSRYNRIQVRYLDQHGVRREEELVGILARVYQHELDHLDGILITDSKRAQMPKLDADLNPVTEQDFRQGAAVLAAKIIAEQETKA